MSVMSVLRLLSDRTAVLFLGVGVGVAMGYAFAGDIARETGAASLAPRPAIEAIKPAVPKQLPELVAPIHPDLLARLSSGSKVRVGVYGDSFGDGIWAGLYHQLRASKAFDVKKFSQQSTGFTRYGSLNLEDRLAEQLASDPVDIAVISFGANDTQGVIHKGHFAALLSPGWKDEIGARIERYVGLLRQHGATVYWVGLPVMKKPSFDADISGMNAFYAEKMAKLDVPFIDTRPMSVDEKGEYAAYLPDPVTHVPRLARANDGIHMSMRGYERLTGGLADRILHYVDGARRRTGGVRTASAALPTVEVRKPAEPREVEPRPPESHPAERHVVETHTDKPHVDEPQPVVPPIEAPTVTPQAEPDIGA